MTGLHTLATTLLAFGAALSATYLRSAQFFQHPVLTTLGLPIGLVLVATGCALLAVGSRRLGSRFSVKGPVAQLWDCRNCGQTNEGTLQACWSCGLPYNLPSRTPSHIPVDSRWQCTRCRVWNGVLRARCWFCGLERKPEVQRRRGRGGG